MTNERARTLLVKLLGVNPDTSDAMRLFLAALQRGQGQAVYIEDGSPKGGNFIDPWRCALCVVLDLPLDVAEDAFRSAARLAMDSPFLGSAPQFSLEERQWDLREVLRRVICLPYDATDADIIKAVAGRLRENRQADSLQLNSAEEAICRQLGFTRREWARLA